ncbi:hypothetical protein Tco_0769122 [Tanacetum coccineum]|uniref:Uncharacterized protein n=1 Tax=Tanacetum coccineum TaxID=301880 RepID=A0ABQ4ZA95_9ASTR
MCSIAGRSQVPKKVTVTDLFYLRGMDVVSINIPYLLARYLRLFASGKKHGVMIFEAPGPERQPGVVVGVHEVAEDAHAVDEGTQADPAPVQAPQPPPPPPAKTMPQRLGRLEEEIQGL